MQWQDMLKELKEKKTPSQLGIYPPKVALEKKMK